MKLCVPNLWFLSSKVNEGSTIDKVKTFKYPGSTITESESFDDEIIKLISNVQAAFSSFNSLWEKRPVAQLEVKAVQLPRSPCASVCM